MGFYIHSELRCICDVCGCKEVFSSTLVRNIRKFKWGLSKDYKKVYCPSCRPKMTRPGPCGSSFMLKK